MAVSLSSIRTLTRSHGGKKFLKYAAGSGISAVISQVTFVMSFGVLHLFGSRGCSIFATLVGTVPSYFLNRHWAWQKRSKSSFSKEVLPYLTMAVLGLVFSTWAADFSNSHSGFLGASHTLKVIFVSGSYFGAFAILWVGKFLFLNRFLFGSPESSSLVSTNEDKPSV